MPYQNLEIKIGGLWQRQTERVERGIAKKGEVGEVRENK